MIEIRDLTKTYRMGDNVVNALQGVTLRIDDGDFVAIMGLSGSGKSTLTHILGLLDVPTSGSYKLDAREVSQLSEDELAVLRRDAIGFIFQQFNLLPRLSALENVGLPLLYSKFHGEPNPKALLETVGLGTRMGHRPNELSGGQQQRVAIARSLVNRPRMIIADEPTGNLDSVSEKEIMRELRALNDSGITVVIVTHEEEIGHQAKRLIRMRDGAIQSDERLAPQPATPKRDFTRAINLKQNKLSEIWEYFRQGFKTLAANKVRTGLSMLGILIGVAAVVAMLALGRGAQNAIKAQLASLGSNLLVLRAGAIRVGGVAQESGSTTRLTLEDATSIQERIPHVRSVSSSVTSRGQVTYLNKNWSTQVQGVNAAYADIHASQPDLGRFFTNEEDKQRQRVAVIGMTLVRELFAGKNPIGEMIKINKVNFQVIGVLPEKGANGFRDQDDVLLVPLNTGMHRLMGKEYVDSVDVEVQDSESIDAVNEDLLQLVLNRHHVPVSQRDEAFKVQNMADIQAAVSQSSQTMSALLAAIAAISLLVGGIGIMNIMLVSVTERTKEIGLRKAVGARRRDILMQFLAESVVVSAVGGVSGIVLGWIITVILSAAAGWATSVSVESALLAFLFSGFTGVVFGIYPARKASHLAPIEALRYE